MATTNIVSLITQFITPEMVGRVSAALGIDRATLQKAFGAAVPGVLAAITSVLARPGGAGKIENAINQQQPGLLANIGSALGTPQQTSAIDTGLSSLSSLLGGGNTSALANALGKYAGLGDSGAKGLLGLLGPMVMGVLGQQSGTGGGIAQVLESQKDNIARALPSGFANYLSGTGLLDQLPGAVTSQATGARSAYRPESSRPTNWVLPVLGTLALLGLGWYLISRPSDRTTTADTTPTTQMQAETRAPGETAFMVAEQDIGKWMHRPVFSSDNTKVGEIVELSRGADDRVTDLYMDAETSLGIGGQRYRVTADKIREVKPDGIVLTLSEADVKAMAPAADQPASQPSP
ncbi:DUF937 domain-containing protein [Hyphomicrobium album]|nr:DUF937 domain-containing protein [Hyphomicrobium album]